MVEFVLPPGCNQPDYGGGQGGHVCSCRVCFSVWSRSMSAVLPWLSNLSVAELSLGVAFLSWPGVVGVLTKKGAKIK